MSENEQINQLHESLNDIYINLLDIAVIDQKGCKARQDALCAVITMRKTMEGMGLHHAPMKTVTQQ